VHLAFLGEPRFHVPETLSMSLLAGCAVTQLGAWWEGTTRRSEAAA
jgi:hypothetical protein